MHNYATFVGLVFAAFAVSVAAGAVLRRWSALFLPVMLVPLGYLGLRLGWWGEGVGDGWQFVGAVVTMVAVATTAAAIVAGRAISRRTRT